MEREVDMKNIEHIKKIRNSILFSVVWRLLLFLMYPVILGVGFQLIGLRLPSEILFILSFIGCMILCLSTVTHVRNIFYIRDALKLYASIERELTETYSIDAKVLDDMLDNTMRKYYHQRSFDQSYALKDLYAIEELIQEERNGEYFDQYLAPNNNVKEVTRMAAVPKGVAEDLLYRVFNSKTAFGATGGKYFSKWHMDRTGEELLPLFQEKRKKINKVK